MFLWSLKVAQEIPKSSAKYISFLSLPDSWNCPNLTAFTKIYHVALCAEKATPPLPPSPLGSLSRFLRFYLLPYFLTFTVWVKYKMFFFKLEFDLVFETMLWTYELLNIDRQDRDKVSQRTLIHPTIFLTYLLSSRITRVCQYPQKS